MTSRKLHPDDRRALVEACVSKMMEWRPDIVADVRAELPLHLSRRLQNLEFRTGIVSWLSAAPDETDIQLEQRMDMLRTMPWPGEPKEPEPDPDEDELERMNEISRKLDEAERTADRIRQALKGSEGEVIERDLTDAPWPGKRRERPAQWAADQLTRKPEFGFNYADADAVPGRERVVRMDNSVELSALLDRKRLIERSYRIAARLRASGDEPAADVIERLSERVR